ncbi:MULTISPECIES: ROK family transcriptional regulator [unclassified Enterobacter]|jgi:predicted NBD/HSP70 family sugar kinase|uniref:ROK family transcriptional regulator n=1 Tax=unclassified Enterobacter TaxID=2608935 RepID=UPI0015C98674|nr:MULTISPECIES: ROK family transcriptional regulator [unclassified Enterobacter]MBB3303913.1 putative NBD/HSP70 family sugar kinase [Enterobacter sp. Sphag1F]NYI12982.1 putative NBD/HSP70 family sugar kinase [Enterobacter sp. Sphag71]
MTASKRVLRNVSVGLVLDLLRNEGPTSQASIARKTGLSPATVNNVIQLLRKEGVADFEWINGREALVTLISTKGVMMSVMVSADFIHGAVFSFEHQKRQDLLAYPDDLLDQQNTPESLAAFIKQLAGLANVSVAALTGVSISIQAPVDKKNGTIAIWSAGRLPGWKDIPIKEKLESLLNVNVHVDNDANLATYAEWTWGAGRGVDCFLYLSCSRQIGSGLIIDGKVHNGSNGMAGELGHLVIDKAGPVCFCGSRGCLTTLVSERAILRILDDTENAKSSLAEVIASANDGDAACQRVLYEAGHNVGQALANTAKIVAPGIVAIGGELGSAWQFIKDSLRVATEENNLDNVSPGIQFVPGILKKDAVLLGGIASLLSQSGQGISDLPDWMTHDAADCSTTESLN